MSVVRNQPSSCLTVLCGFLYMKSINVSCAIIRQQLDSVLKSNESVQIDNASVVQVRNNKDFNKSFSENWSGATANKF